MFEHNPSRQQAEPNLESNDAYKKTNPNKINLALVVFKDEQGNKHQFLKA